MGSSIHDFDFQAIPIDTLALIHFSKKVNERFFDYYESSQGKTSVVNNVHLGNRGEPVGTVFMNCIPQRLVLYTFDEIDSCVLFDHQIRKGSFLLSAYDLPIPPGKYWLFDRKGKTDYYRSKNNKK